MLTKLIIFSAGACVAKDIACRALVLSDRNRNIADVTLFAVYLTRFPAVIATIQCGTVTASVEMYRTHTEDPWPDVQDALHNAKSNKAAVCMCFATVYVWRWLSGMTRAIPTVSHMPSRLNVLCLKHI